MKKSTIEQFLIFLFLVTSIIGWCFYFNKSYKIPYDRMSKKEKYITLVETWKYYRSLSAMDIHCAWEKKFVQSKYKLANGNILLNEYNCSTAVIDFLWDFGSLAIMEKSNEIGDRLERYVKLDLAKKRNKVNDVGTTDIIIFHPGKSGISHIGIVERINHKKKIVYMDMNGIYDDVGFRYISWGDYRIKNIYSCSFAFWCGEFFKEIKDLE